MDISELWVELETLNLDQLNNIKNHIQTIIKREEKKIFLSKLSIYQKHIVEDYEKEYQNILWDAEHNDQNNAISVLYNYSTFEQFMKIKDDGVVKIVDDMFNQFHKKFVEWKGVSRLG